MNAAAENLPPVDFRTDPARYRHWRLSVEGVEIGRAHV